MQSRNIIFHSFNKATDYSSFRAESWTFSTLYFFYSKKETERELLLSLCVFETNVQMKL